MSTPAELSPFTAQPIAAAPSNTSADASKGMAITASPGGVHTASGFVAGRLPPADDMNDDRQRVNAANAQKEREKSTICSCCDCCTIV
jgi:hypothetical protein